MEFIFALDPAPNTWGEVLLRWGIGVLIFLSTTVVSYILGRLVGTLNARRQWAQKQFLGRIHISINSLRDGTLRIRTLMERSLEEVFLNPVAVEKVLAAVRKTTPESPLLPMAAEDRWFLLSFALNAVAEHFVPGVIRQDAGLPVDTVRYVMFLACEQEGDDRIRKVRALLVQETELQNFKYRGDVVPKLEIDYHIDRVRTLRQAAEKYQTDRDLFIRLEVCV